MLSRHPTPIPESCDVCAYAAKHQLDPESEHALTRLATMMMIQSLGESGGGPSRMQRLAMAAWDPGKGAIHELAPRHWHWALFFEPALQIVLVEEEPHEED